jgi:hypothetical protein
VKIKESGAQNDKDEFWGTPAVKENAEKEDYRILQLFTGQIISNKKEREKIQKKYNAAENHKVRVCSFLWL